jgi:hypothetical protein
MRLESVFEQADTQQVAANPRDFDTQCGDLLRQLVVAMREAYFHPSKVPASVMGDEGRAMPQQQQQVGVPE